MSTAPVVQVANTGAAAATHTTASFTPPANTRLVAYVSCYKATAGVALPTISDTGSLTWTQLHDYSILSTFSNPDLRSTWFISTDVGGSPASRTVTVASTGAASMGVTVGSVLTSEVSGSTVQVASGESDTGDPSLTFGSAPGAANITLVGTSHVGANAITNPSGYTTLAQATHSTARRAAVVYDITSAGQTATWASNNARSIELGIELAPATGDQTITGALFTDADTFFGATVTAGAVNIDGALFTNANSFFASTVSATYDVTGALYSDADTFFGATVSTAYGITGALYTDADTFFAATVSQAGDQAVSGALYANDNTFFGATIAGETISTDRGGDGFSSTGGYVRERRKHRHTTRNQLERLLNSTAEEPPPPTKKRIKALKREIVEEVSEGLGAPAKQELAQFVQREVAQVYQPGINWTALARAVEHLMRQAAEEAERIEQEIEDEDEMVLLMVA